MDFEYNPTKSKKNFDKHGIDFEEAKELWKDIRLTEIDSYHLDEHRVLMIGKIGDKVWTAVTTLRNGNIRIISVRRSRKNEIQLYEG